jgi:hypothetical protein
MNNLVYIFSDLLFAPLPLQAPTLWLHFWFALEHLFGECSARLLRWMLLSASGAAGGGVPPVYYGNAERPCSSHLRQADVSILAAVCSYIASSSPDSTTFQRPLVPL